MNFRLTSEYKPTGDQPQAIDQLARGVLSGVPAQTLLGVTGSGKTFTMANVIERVQRPTLILSHNKTLAAQLYAEMKSFFPDNAVEYFVSYYDYYQPEAYIPSLDKYIEKDLMINDEIDRLRLSTTSALLSGRQDVVVVSSVSCIYGMGNPDDFNSNVVEVKAGMKKSRNAFLRELVQALYSRNEVDFARGSFRVKGDTVDIYLAYEDIAVRVIFWGDEVESVSTFHPSDNVSLGNHDSFKIFPANLFVTSPTRLAAGLSEISVDLGTQAAVFESEGKLLEAQRLRERVTYDIEMMREVGHCPGIENYSRYFDGRQPGMRPFCLLDYFPKDFLTIIDESHVTLPQIRAMYGGDQSRKHNLVNYGFRLQAALDNRPLKFEEFQELTPQTIYVSATPADFELQASEGVVVEQIIRPTGLLDPRIVVRPTMNQIDDLLEEIETRRERNERVLVTTLTKRMAEELHEYMQKLRIKSAYIHSDVDTLDRIRILDDLRAGVYDVLVGVNLLREGLDLPEVSLVAILDADKEGFLRSHRSLTQTVGRAARHLDGMVIMYADTVTESMQQTIDETERRRNLQLAYNAEHGITPAAIVKARLRFIGMDKESADSDVEAAMSHADGSALAEKSKARSRSGSSPRKATPEDRREERRTTRSTSMYDAEFAGADIAADPLMPYMDAEWMQRHINDLRSQMLEAARQMEFIEAARLRDQILKLEQMLADKQSKQP